MQFGCQSGFLPTKSLTLGMALSTILWHLGCVVVNMHVDSYKSFQWGVHNIKGMKAGYGCTMGLFFSG